MSDSSLSNGILPRGTASIIQKKNPSGKIKNIAKSLRSIMGYRVRNIFRWRRN
jgi:hypothetical protein